MTKYSYPVKSGGAQIVGVSSVRIPNLSLQTRVIFPWWNREGIENVVGMMDVRDSTKANYRLALRPFCRYVERVGGLYALTLRHYKQWLLSREDINPTTKQNYLAVAQSFMMHLARMGYLQNVARVRSIVTNDRMRTPAFSDREAAAMERHARGMNRSDKQRRDRAIFYLFLDHGFRVNEIVGLQVADLNYSERTLAVRGKGDDHARHVVRLSGKAYRAIISYLRAEDKPTFCRLYPASQLGPLFLGELSFRNRQGLTTSAVRKAMRPFLSLTRHPGRTHMFRARYITKMLEGFDGDAATVAKLSRHRHEATVYLYDRRKLTDRTYKKVERILRGRYKK